MPRRMTLTIAALLLPLAALLGQDTEERLAELEKRMDEVLARIEQLQQQLSEGGPFFMWRMPRGQQFGDIEREIQEMLEGMRGMRGMRGWRAPGAVAFLGVAPRDLDAAEAAANGLKPGAGAYIEEVIAGSAAEAADLRPGDIIVSLDGQPISGPAALVDAVRACEPGEEVRLIIRRGGKEMEVAARLGSAAGAPLSRAPWRFGVPLPDKPARRAEQAPSVDVKVQGDRGEVTLSIQTNELAVTDDVATAVGLSGKERERLEKILADARGLLAERLTPQVTAMLQKGGSLQINSAAVERALHDTVAEILPRVQQALGDEKAQKWQQYVAANRYVNQSISVRKSAGAPPAPPVPHGGKVRSF